MTENIVRAEDECNNKKKRKNKFEAVIVHIFKFFQKWEEFFFFFF